MASITFRAKPETIYNMDNTIAYERIKIPAITRRHCDMNAFRQHPKFGSYANSDLFISMVNIALKTQGIGTYLRLDRPLPSMVSVDHSGFLTLVTIDL